MPPYVGVARRIVLDQLGNRYHRTFTDVWEFVTFTGSSASTSTSPARRNAPRRRPPPPSRDRQVRSITPRLLSSQVVRRHHADHATSSRSARVKEMFRLAISGLSSGAA